ncbi:MAG: single-stranded-DNA-specific exonuclease RecJ [Bacteroidales bacterium]|nr:single-stranded-DNA-specific exonuclease RecJ [Bacteroidales bacterium]MBN2762923.1 single-stranded-DNA-specific exonuclease RecJ [Bacteroidales bacterium]
MRAWKIKENGHHEDINRLARELNIDNILATLLIQRGIDTYPKAKAFFRPDLNDLYDPFLMNDMEKAVDRLKVAIGAGEKILIYGDYDVDGTTSVAMVYSFLKKYHDKLDFYIPDRYAEGYGISYKAIDYAGNNAVTLIIALDCGIKAVEKVAYAKKKGIDFIICDHHTPDDKLPDAVAVLDPERNDSTYPFQFLSGCGVGFKLLQAYSIRNKLPFEDLKEYLDLLAVSIASDIVPMVNENRILAYYGIQKLNKNPRVGIRSIIRAAGIERRLITIDDIVFKIGPRINAAGRIESGKQAVDLLISEKDEEADLHCERINSHNQTRRNIDKTITEEAMKETLSCSDRYKYSTVLFNPSWHKGVVGIVASRLIESFYRPTIILTESNGFATGSARSVPGFDLYQAISQCSDLLESFGGHMYAAGLTLKIENVAKFRDKFENVVKDTITQEQMIPQIEIDTELNFRDVTPKFFKILKQFEPFGPENLNPVFFAENVADNGSARVVGSKKEHLQLNLIQEDIPFNNIKAIAFNQAHHFEKIKKVNGFDIAFTLMEDTFRGNSMLQLNVKDIRI